MTTDVTSLKFDIVLPFYVYVHVYIYNMHVMYLPKLKCDDA